MDDADFAADFEGLDAPWWLDGVADSDVVVCTDQWAVLGEFGPLSVAETLHSIRVAGPGPEAERLLMSLAGQQLTGDEALTAVELWQAQTAFVAGAEQQAILQLVGLKPDPADKVASLQGEFAAHELAPALNISTDAAQARIETARLMATTLKATGDKLRAGALDPYRVWVITETLLTVAPDIAQQIEAQILPVAATLTGAKLRRALRNAARKADPDWGVRMFAASRRSRRVGFDFRGDDGLVQLTAWLAPVEGLAMAEHLRKAAAVRSADPDDDRNVDERLADALVACVLGSTPGDPTSPAAPKVNVGVLIALPTLLGLRHDTAELVGYGPIPDGMARELADAMTGDVEFRRMVYDPVDGHLLDYGRDTYRPPKRLDDFRRARDRLCRFPGSGRSASSSDGDHTNPFVPTGRTSADNIVSLSRSAHRAKTHGHFQTSQDPDGTLHWITPLGRRYTTRPWDYRPDSER
jgi:hypothetical protein